MSDRRFRDRYHQATRGAGVGPQDVCFQRLSSTTPCSTTFITKCNERKSLCSLFPGQHEAMQLQPPPHPPSQALPCWPPQGSREGGSGGWEEVEPEEGPRGSRSLSSEVYILKSNVYFHLGNSKHIARNAKSCQKAYAKHCWPGLCPLPLQPRRAHSPFW